LSDEEILKKLGPDALKRWRSSDPKDWDFRFPGGESSREVVERMTLMIQKILRDDPHLKSMAVVSHGGVLRRYLRSIAPDFTESLPWITNGMVFQVEWDDAIRGTARLSPHIIL
jgi:broad specificity phosphatase PhoE